MPPEAPRVCEYAVPTVPVTIAEGVSDNVGHKGASVYVLLPGQPLTSVACTVKVWLLVEVGVPLSAPALLKVRPAGSVPLVTVQV